MKMAYPVVFTPVKEGGFAVYIPDLNLYTQGDDLAEAMYMARDCIGAWACCEEDEGRSIPEPSSTLPEVNAGEITSFVDIDLKEYRRAFDTTSERTNVTLPRYLKKRAEAAGLNFSQELKERLEERLR